MVVVWQASKRKAQVDRLGRLNLIHRKILLTRSHRIVEMCVLISDVVEYEPCWACAGIHMFA